ncbi:MAG: hypothetical protein ABIN67_02175 [Ferruginibacter sp.]
MKRREFISINAALAPGFFCGNIKGLDFKLAEDDWQSLGAAIMLQ